MRRRNQPVHVNPTAARSLANAQYVAESIAAVLKRPATEADREAGAAVTSAIRAYEAPMSSAAINDLPDSAFAYIEPGGKKDEDGKTVPRSLRHFPIHDAPHVRNALSRAPQSPFGDKAMPKIRAAAKKLGIGAPAAGQKEALEPARHERLTVTEAPTFVKTAPTKPGRLLVQLIKAGWSGNDRYYPESVLKRDGPKVFPAGTLNFVDHDTEEQQAERPSGSLTRLASVQMSDAFYDPVRKALMAEVRVFEPWREAVLDWADSGAIGMSIRAYAEGDPGKAEGKEGLIISALTEGRSVDYVTKPAAGGAIVSVLEHLGKPQPVAEARNIGTWLESRLHLALTQLGDEMYGDGRLTREERIALSSAIGDALKAWTAKVEADAPGLFSRDLYDDPDKGVTANEQEEQPEVTAPTPAVVEPPEVPPAQPAEEPPSTDEPDPAGEPDPPGTEPAGPVPTEEGQEMPPDTPGAQTPASPGSARQVIEAEVAQLRRETAQMRARERAREVLAATLADGWIPPATTARITESLMTRLPMSGDALDEGELIKLAGNELRRAEGEIAEAMQAAGLGRVRDLGGGSYSGGPVLDTAALDKRLEEAFLGLGNTDKVAKAAARGRD